MSEVANYADEISLLLSARDEMSTRLKEVQKNLKTTEQRLGAARREFENTGAPEAAQEYKRLADEHQRLSGTQRELAKSLSSTKKEMSKLTGEADKGTKSMGRFATSMEKHAKSIQRTGLVVGAAMAYMAMKSLDAASHLAESSSKNEAVFKRQNRTVSAWAKTSVEKFGLSEQAALEYAASYGNLFQAFGLTEKKSASMSRRLTELAVDLASFNNTDVDSALNALQSGMTGEMEPMKRYGATLTDLRMREKARALGLVKDTKHALNPAIKAQAAYALILQDTRKAQGDYARTADGFANKQRRANAEMDNASAKLGTALLPLATIAVGVFGSMVSYVSGLPDPLRNATLAVAVLGTAAMIATPRILVMRAAIMGASGGVGLLARSGTLLAGLLSPAGLIGLAVAGGVVAWKLYSDAQANAKADADALGATLDKTTGKITSQTHAVIAAKLASTLSTEELGMLSQAGITPSRFADAVLKPGTSGKFFNKRLNEFQQGAARDENKVLLTGISVVRREMGYQTDALGNAKTQGAIETKVPTLTEVTAENRKWSAVNEKTAKILGGLPANSKMSLEILRNIEGNTAGLRNSELGRALAAVTPKKKLATGGSVFGPGSGTSDSIPAMLSNGEFVLRERAARAIGYGTLDKMNKSGQIPYVPALQSDGKNRTIIRDDSGTPSQVIHQTITATGQVDFELAMRREARSAERDRRTRFAGTSR